MFTRIERACLAFLFSRGGFLALRRGLQGLMVLALIAVAMPVRAEGPDDLYLQLRGVIEQADAMGAQGQVDLAKAKYLDARSRLLRLKELHPTWNAKLVAYRLNYVTEKFSALSQPAPTPSTNVAATSKPETQPQLQPTAPPAGALVKLLDAGAEPRKALRIHAAPGNKQTLGLTAKMALDMGMGGGSGQTMKLPAIQLTMEATVKSVSSDGDMAYEIVIADASVADEPGTLPQIAEAMKAALGSVKGLASTGSMSSRGISQGGDMKLPPGADPQMRQSMDLIKESLSNISLPLPEEAVGSGAKWEVKQALKSQGMTIQQTATYQLASVEGERVIVKGSMVQTAADQKIQNPAIPALKMDVAKMTGEGNANLAFDLSRLLPSRATAESRAEISMEMNVGGQKQAMTMKTDMNIRLEAK
jgi:hypothetical protein